MATCEKYTDNSIRDRFGYNPLLSLRDNTKEEVPRGQSALRDSLILAQEGGRDALSLLFDSGDRKSLVFGLFIFSQMQEAKLDLINEAIGYIDVPSPWAKKYIIEGCTRNISFLPPEGLSELLIQYMNKDRMVREAIMGLLIKMPSQLAHGALDTISDPQIRESQRECIEMLTSEKGEAKLKFVTSGSSGYRIYGFARYLREALYDRIFETPESDDVLMELFSDKIGQIKIRYLKSQNSDHRDP